jgi:hypothetical protein
VAALGYSLRRLILTRAAKKHRDGKIEQVGAADKINLLDAVLQGTK